MKMNIISIINLNAGLHWCEKNNWEKDVLNAVYHQTYDIRSKGINEWWNATVDRLSQWGVLRPYSRANIIARGNRHLIDIECEYRKLLKKSPVEPSIADLRWEDAAPLFALASEIKPVESPAFSSKMCHLLFPKLFIQMDNNATGICYDYARWWQDRKDKWLSFKDKGRAETIILDVMKSDKPIHDLYPMETKIIEINEIGRRHPSVP